MISHFHLQPSRQLTLLFSLLYIGAAIIICLSLPISGHLKLVLLLMHGLHFYTIWHNTIRLKSPCSIIYLQHTETGEWLLGQQDGTAYRATLQSGSLCTFYFISLRFKLIPTDQYKTLFLLSDHLNPTEARQLRRLLWWGL